MNSKNSLTWGMACFFLIVFVSLGLLVINEKKVELLLPRIEKKLTAYLEDNYKDVKAETTTKLNYDDKKQTFMMKVANKKNNHLYFYISYHHKQIKDTYKTDYLEGKSLRNYHERKLQQDLKRLKLTFSINEKYNKLNDEVKKALLTKDDIKDLKIYTVNHTQKLSTFNQQELINYIQNLQKELQEQQYQPKNYSLTLINGQDITQFLEIKNLTPNRIATDLETIVNRCLSQDKTIENKYDISCNYEETS